jgi:hypothetical protein
VITPPVESVEGWAEGAVLSEETGGVTTPPVESAVCAPPVEDTVTELEMLEKA